MKGEKILENFINKEIAETTTNIDTKKKELTTSTALIGFGTVGAILDIANIGNMLHTAGEITTTTIANLNISETILVISAGFIITGSIKGFRLRKEVKEMKKIIKDYNAIREITKTYNAKK